MLKKYNNKAAVFKLESFLHYKWKIEELLLIIIY